MNRHIIALLALSSSVCTSFAGALGVDWYSNPPTAFMQAGGGASIDSSYTFTLGVFSATPAWASGSDVASKFVSIEASAPYDAANGWAYISTTYNDLGSTPNAALLAPALGKQLYVVGFNNSSVAAASQLFVATNSSWVLPAAFPSLSDGVTFQFEDPGTQLFVGTASLNLVTFDAVAVPEPSTYAAALGAMVLGVVGFRRFRRR